MLGITNVFMAKIIVNKLRFFICFCVNLNAAFFQQGEDGLGVSQFQIRRKVAPPVAFFKISSPSVLRTGCFQIGLEVLFWRNISYQTIQQQSSEDWIELGQL